jgi:DNA-binding MarR family transcriptional regulator
MVLTVPASLEDLGRAVKQLQYRHHRGMDQRLRQIGTSLAQWDALRAISRRPNSSAHALAELTFQTDQSFGALASRLVRAGLIERKAGRGRAIWHRLTPKGQSVLKKGYDVIGDVLDVSFGPLSRRQREQLYRFLKRALEDGEPAQRVGF